MSHLPDVVVIFFMPDGRGMPGRFVLARRWALRGLPHDFIPPTYLHMTVGQRLHHFRFDVLDQDGRNVVVNDARVFGRLRGRKFTLFYCRNLNS